jgi:hypothetical protein
MTAAEKAKSQTESLLAPWRFQNSTTAERRQKRERWAKAPNSSPMTRPARVMLVFSPRSSIRLFRSIIFASKTRSTATVQDCLEQLDIAIATTLTVHCRAAGSQGIGLDV